MEMLQRVLPDVLTRAVANHQQFRGRHAAASARGSSVCVNTAASAIERS